MFTGFLVIDAFIAAIYGIFRCLKWMFEGFITFMSVLIVLALVIGIIEKIREQK